MPGEARVGDEKFPYWRQQTWRGLVDWGKVGGEAKEKEFDDDTYSCADKAFILHTNCFAEHFVTE